MSAIKCHWLGLCHYEETLEKQLEAHDAVLRGGPDQIFGVEHPAVITLGKRGGVIRKENRAPVVQIGRGGLATAHEPGQLVIYPIVHLERRKIAVRSFVCLLEQMVMDWISALSLSPRRSTSPGIWIGEKKVCSVGLQIKRGVALHGIAINIHNSLGTFLHIEACGLPQSPMGTLSQLHPNPPHCETAFQGLSSILVDRIENI